MRIVNPVGSSNWTTSTTSKVKSTIDYIYNTQAVILNETYSVIYVNHMNQKQRVVGKLIKVTDKTITLELPHTTRTISLLDVRKMSIVNKE